MIPVKIIKHQNPTPLKEYGDILYPFENWESTTTGGGWYSKISDNHFDSLYYPLTAVAENSWKALELLNVECKEFKDLVRYKCPYNEYIHFWCVPVLIFTNATI